LRREKKDDGALQEKSGESEGDAEWPTGRMLKGFLMNTWLLYLG
jgi:hypothetical protein